MDFIKGFRWNAAVFSAGSVGLGTVLSIRPDLGGPAIRYLLAALLLLGSAGHFVSYASGHKQNLPARTDLTVGILLGFSAILAAIQAQQITGWIPVIMGGIFSANGAVKLQKSLLLKQVQYRGWRAVAICALLTIGLGVVLLFNPFVSHAAAVRVLGAGLFFSGLSDLVTMASVSRQLQKDMLSGVSRLENGASKKNSQQ